MRLLDLASGQGWPVIQQICYPLLFSIVATCSFPVLPCGVCALCGVHFLVVAGETTPFPHFLGIELFKCSAASADLAPGGDAATAAKAIFR